MLIQLFDLRFIYFRSDFRWCHESESQSVPNFRLYSSGLFFNRSMDMFDISVIEGTEVESGENTLAETSNDDSSVGTSSSLPNPKFTMTTKEFLRDANFSPESHIEAVIRSCIAIAWSWPWTVLYEIKKKRLYYFNETRQVLFTEIPNGSCLRTEDVDSLPASHERLNAELLYREFSLRGEEISQDTSVFHLAERFYGADKASINLQVEGDPESGHGCFTPLKRNLLNTNHRVHDGLELVNLKSLSIFANQILSKSRQIRQSSPLSRPSSSPSFTGTRPSSSGALSRLKVSVSLWKKDNEGSYLCFDSPHKASGVRSLVISILLHLRENENRVLRERIFKKHMLLAAQRQRRLFEGVKVISKTKKTRRQNSPTENLHYKGCTEESSPSYNSLSDMFSSLSIERLRESEFAFERSMSLADHNEYLNLLNEATSNASRIETSLKLIFHLIKCKASDAAVSLTHKVCEDLPTKGINDIDNSFMDILYKSLISQFFGHYPNVSDLRDLASRHSDDTMLLAFVAVHLDKMEYTDEAEAYFLASLIRDPRNQVALRGYAHLLSLKRGDYISAIKYLSRIGSEFMQSDASVAKLEMVCEFDNACPCNFV